MAVAARERDPAQVRAEIEWRRAELAREVAALSAEVHATADWRAWVRRRPGLLLGGAFALGFVVGSR